MFLQLSETKTQDRKSSLMHFLAETLQEQFSTLANFDRELSHVEAAAQASLDELSKSVSELNTAMEATRKEYELRKNLDAPQVLKEFIHGDPCEHS